VHQRNLISLSRDCGPVFKESIFRKAETGERQSNWLARLIVIRHLIAHSVSIISALENSNRPKSHEC